MNSPHLSPVQLSEWALGQRSLQAAGHVAQCAACRAQVEEFDQALGGFRNSISQWSEAQLARSTAAAFRPEPKRAHQRPRVWVAAFACVMALVFILIVRDAGVSKQPAPLTAQEESALLTQIDQEVSRTVPAAMDPLSSLVAGDGARAVSSHEAAGNAKIQ